MFMKEIGRDLDEIIKVLQCLGEIICTECLEGSAAWQSIGITGWDIKSVESLGLADSGFKGPVCAGEFLCELEDRVAYYPSLPPGIEARL